jgi:hypothetical protein
MTQTMEEQADAALYPETQTVSQQPSMNPIRLISSALRSGLMGVQQDNSWEMTRITQSVDQCKQHVRNQISYTQRIDDASRKASDALALQSRQISTLTTSATNHGRTLQTLTGSMSELLTLARANSSAASEQATRLANLEVQVRSFEEGVTIRCPQQEGQGEHAEPQRGAGLTQPQTPSFFEVTAQPQTPHPPRRTRVGRLQSRSPSPSDNEWPALSRRSMRESTVQPSVPQPGSSYVERQRERTVSIEPEEEQERTAHVEPQGEEERTIHIAPTSFSIPKEVRVKKAEPFSGKKGREAETFIMRMEVYFDDYEEGTFPDNRKITATLINMSPGEGANWADPILRCMTARTPHAYTTNWNTFKEAFLLNFSDPIKKEKAIRELGSLTQTKSAQSYASQFRILSQEVSWDRTAMIDKFKEGLKPQVKMELMKVTMMITPDVVSGWTLENWIELAIRTDDMLFSSQKSNPKANTPSTSSYRPSGSTSTSKPATSRPTQDKAKTQNVKVPDEEKQRRRKEGLCIKCGKPNHNMSEFRTGWLYKGKEKVQGKASSTLKEDKYETESEN